MVYLGVSPTAVTYAWAMSRMDTSRAVSFLYLIPVMAYLIALPGEAPTLPSVLGGVITLTGVLLVNARGRRR